MNALAGISETNRRRLTILHRSSSGLVDVEEAADLLKLNRVVAAKLLARWATQGWVRRLRRGLYLLIPLEAVSPEDWRVDPWVIATRLFKPGYIAGWSASEYWGFTEQIFRDIAFFTVASIRERKLTLDDTTFVLRKIRDRHLFGLQTAWRNNVKVNVSDPTRTLVDIFNEPRWGGGIRHAAQVLNAYGASEHYDEALLLQYVKRLGNAAVAKRLGYLWESRLPAKADTPLLVSFREMISPGYALLDPTVEPRGPFVAKWNLRVNVALGQHD